MSFKVPFALLPCIVLSIFLYNGGSRSSIAARHNGKGGFLTTLFSPNSISSGEGYSAVIQYEDGFLAAGSDGRIDRISISGEIIKSEKLPGEDINCILSFHRIIIAAGNEGVMLFSHDNGKFSKINSGTEKSINALTAFKEKIIAGANDGEILTGDEKGTFKKSLLDLKGNILSLSAGISDCYGVTDKGEIIHSTDGINWDIFDFNKYYAGFYKACCFTKVLVTANRIAVTGSNADGSPALYFSTQGNVWTERSLSYIDDKGTMIYLKDTPNDIFYDKPEDQFILIFNKGKIMEIPSCSHCNKLIEISGDNLKGISGYENTVAIVGGNFYIKVIKTD